MISPLVSVVVTTRNSGRTIGTCLRSVQRQSYKPVESIVVDNHSTDNTVRIARSYTPHVLTAGPERSAQRNVGAAKAKGKFLCILDSDMVVSPHVIASCVNIISSDSSCVAVVIPEESFGQGFWASCKKLERSYYIGVDWMEAARFFNRAVFGEVGGYDPKLTGTEDYDLPHRIVQKYGARSIARVDDTIMHNEGRMTLLSTCKAKFSYARSVPVYSRGFANAEYFKKQANIALRYKLFLSQPRKLAANPILGAGLFAMKACEFAAGGFGYLRGLCEK